MSNAQALLLPSLSLATSLHKTLQLPSTDAAFLAFTTLLLFDQFTLKAES